ncbi:hypothetical protein CLV30_108147 [Haloactinopolyspora alba]|uniref:Integral membrane protein n=1 Tax=Haloactinopolyspora alba TaxID=648780 RepID=A0A2P8E194_9ACTN|nr:hypothetical protein [Haloactinopolyspora alba]PSL03235.1 hypothetical protein CLV30_108147 [Haloactinopolyspora alba]
MEYVYDLVLVLHFVGLASLLGGAMVQMSARDGRTINAAMVHGALTQLVTGVAMAGMGDAVGSLDIDVNHAKIGVKLAIALVVTVLCWVNRRKDTVAGALYATVFALTLANVVVAVFWG